MVVYIRRMLKKIQTGQIKAACNSLRAAQETNNMEVEHKIQKNL